MPHQSDQTYQIIIFLSVKQLALKLNTNENDKIANIYLSEAIRLTNKREIKNINEYVLNWGRWPNANLLSVTETLNYLYLYASKTDNDLAKMKYVKLVRYGLQQKLWIKVGITTCIDFIDKALEFAKNNEAFLLTKKKATLRFSHRIPMIMHFDSIFKIDRAPTNKVTGIKLGGHKILKKIGNCCRELFIGNRSSQNSVKQCPLKELSCVFVRLGLKKRIHNADHFLF